MLTIIEKLFSIVLLLQCFYITIQFILTAITFAVKFGLKKIIGVNFDHSFSWSNIPIFIGLKTIISFVMTIIICISNIGRSFETVYFDSPLLKLLGLFSLIIGILAIPILLNNKKLPLNP